MSQASIRLVRSTEIDSVITAIKKRYVLLSEAEIIKLALSELYNRITTVAEE